MFRRGQYLRCEPEVVQMPSRNKTIATIVTRSCYDQDAWMAAWGVLRCNGAGHREARELHELIHAESKVPHEFFINVDCLILASAQRLRHRQQLHSSLTTGFGERVMVVRASASSWAFPSGTLAAQVCDSRHGCLGRRDGCQCALTQLCR